MVGKLDDLVGYFIHFETVQYPSLGDHIVSFFVVNPGHSEVFPSRFTYNNNNNNNYNNNDNYNNYYYSFERFLPTLDASFSQGF